MPAPPTETELKLQLAAADVDRVRQSAALSQSACSEVDIDNVYYDTRDLLLRRHRMSLRVRQVGRRWVQTLKADSKSSGTVARRGEWETPARVVSGQGRLDLARLDDSPLPTLLIKQKTPPELEAVFTTRVRRALWNVERSGAVIEVALDIGEISAEHDGRSLQEPICEVELELKRGDALALIELALELVKTDGEKSPAMTPVVRSKAERGYHLASQQRPPAIKASAKGFVKNLTNRSSTGSVLRAVIAHGFAVLMANIELLLNHDDPEYVHQARVALRRVRSAIRLFDGEERDVPHGLSDELRWFAHVLGAARDWDVIAGEVLPSLGDAIDADALKLLVAKANLRSQQAHANIRKAARSSRYAELILNGEKWCMTPVPAGSVLFVDAAAPALKRAAKKLFKQARFFAALSPPQRHQVRILAKRLRYALDLFAVALPKTATERYIDALAELQDVLGQLNDAAVAKAVLPQLSKSNRLKRSAATWFDSVEPDRVHDAERRLLKLSSLQKPWQ
jgi:triphosphatase